MNTQRPRVNSQKNQKVGFNLPAVNKQEFHMDKDDEETKSDTTSLASSLSFEDYKPYERKPLNLSLYCTNAADLEPPKKASLTVYKRIVIQPKIQEEEKKEVIVKKVEKPDEMTKYRNEVFSASDKSTRRSSIASDKLQKSLKEIDFTLNRSYQMIKEFDESNAAIEKVCDDRLKEQNINDANFYYYKQRGSSQLLKINKGARHTHGRALTRNSSLSLGYKAKTGQQGKINIKAL